MSLVFDKVSLALNGTTVLRELSFTLDAGEQVALIGPSGAGKTSLLLLANTLYRPSSGQLRLLEQSPWTQTRNGLRQLRADIGSVYQSPPLPARQRVVNAVTAGRLGRMGLLESLWSLLAPRDAAGVQTALARVDLADKLWARCDTLSGGQLQRVGIARVLYQQPRLLLADEPVAALDPRLAEATVRLLCDDARTRGASLLISLHSVELALAYFPRLIGVRDGKIMFDLPRAEVTQDLLSALYAGEQPAAPSEPEPYVPALPKDIQC